MAENNWGIKLDSDGTDRVTLDNNFDIKDLDAFTFEMWVKPKALATVSNQRAFSIRQGSSKRGIRFACVPIEGKLRFEFARVDGTSDTNYSYAYDWDGYWHHVAFTADIGAKEYKIYIDGGLVQTGRIVDGGEDGGVARKITNSATTGVFVGAWSPDSTESNFIYWDGRIDNIRLWSVVRSEADILANKDDHIDTGATGLIDEWRFNEGSGFTSAGAKNPAWTGTHYRLNGGVQTSTHWDIDRPFLGDGVLDVDPPADNTMSAPTNIGSDGFTLNWTATTDDVAVQYYEITVATDSAFSSVVSGYSALNVGLVTTYDVEGLTPSTNYYARVRAFDAAGNASSYQTYNTNAAITTSAAADLTPPTAPVATSATAITDTDFTANWGAATDDVAVTGYKLDVAEDSAFTTFVAGFRNLDVGLVLTYDVTSAIDPSKTYYYRVRAYDAAFNESADSNTITVTTSAPPDTEAPSIVVTQTPTSVGSRSFTARWNTGVDNVAVTGYLFDLATDENFTQFVSGYENLDVGNVTSYGVTFLTAQTGYYYRVRAYDAAGNISEDTDSPELIATRASTVEEGGTIEVGHFAVEDTYTDQGASATNFATATSLTVDGSPDESVAYLFFDLNEITGTIVNANLRLYVTDASVGTFNVQLVDGLVDVDTITYANDASVLTGTAVEFTPSIVDSWVEVDIASLLSGAAGYWIAIHTTSTDALIFNSADATSNTPELVVETDPTSSTELDSFTLTAENASRINLLKNPSAETGGTAFGGATGITQVGAATLLQDDTYAYAGDYSCKVSTTAVAGDGVSFASEAALAIAGTGQTFTGRVSLRSASALTSVTVALKITYTDATSTTGSAVATFLNAYWRDWMLPTAVATSGKTVDKVELLILNSSAAAVVFWVDAVVVMETGGDHEDIAFFDGDTHPTDADWDGTEAASQSTYTLGQILVDATYLGDGDEDNSVSLRFKRSSEADWVTNPSLVGSIDRGTKQVTATVGEFYVGNYLYNPTFGNGVDTLWGSNVGGVTRTVLTNQVGFDDEETWGVLQVDTDGSLASQGVAYYGYHIRALSGTDWVFSVYLKGAVGGEKVKLQLLTRDSTLAVLETETGAELTLTADWQRYELQFTPTTFSLSRMIHAYVVTSGTLAQTFYLHAAQLEQGLAANPYIDGTQIDGVWSGREHESLTYRLLSHEVEYDVELEFTDPDGVVGTNPASSAITTSVIPDDPLTAVSLTLTPSNDEIAAVAAYTGDDNETATVRVQWKRSDLSSWSTGAYTWDRDNKQVLATIANLKPGTDYDVKMTFSDTDDGVYGVNPLQTTATTTITGLTAAAKEKISFGGFMLSGDDDSGFHVTEHDAFSHPERLTQVEQLARTDGAVELSDWWGKRVIRLKGVVMGDSRSDLYNRIAELRKALAPRQQRLVIDTLAANNYFFNATCTSLGIMEIGGETFRHVLYDAEFTCADPFRYEASETTESDIELFDDEEVVITNDGDIHIDPTFTITTTSNDPVSLTLVNVTTGERITPDGTITSGDRLVIDSSKLSATKNGVEIDYAGGFPRLATGQNTITVVLSTGSISMTVRRRHRYL